jgi:hypothetical protein
MHPTRLRCENATYPQYAFHFHALSAGRLSCQFCELIFARTLNLGLFTNPAEMQVFTKPACLENFKIELYYSSHMVV